MLKGCKETLQQVDKDKNYDKIQRLKYDRAVKGPCNR